MGGTGHADYIINSYNTGNILQKNGSLPRRSACGIMHYTISSTKIINVYNIGEIVANSRQGIAYSKDGFTETYPTAYYKNDDGIKGGNFEDVEIGTGMLLANMKTNAFVSTLNSNLNNIKLEEIDAILKDYNLKSWKLGDNGYPILE